MPQEQTAYETASIGVVLEKVEQQCRSQQRPRCGCPLEENRDGQRFECPDCSYSMNADYNVANNAARRAALRLQRGQNSLAGDSFC
ncbi:zinc ribbon domain-containing protein [Halorientalis sp.]|uniref:zinc ribbon domain-containing protein n=1 Tax=Halorientalis sp. TaxID=1931229 RepID=UPI0039C86E44